MRGTLRGTMRKLLSGVESVRPTNEKKMSVPSKKAKVIKSFEAQSTDQLDINEGEIVVITGN